MSRSRGRPDVRPRANFLNRRRSYRPLGRASLLAASLGCAGAGVVNGQPSSVEQTSPGRRAPAHLVVSFDGLGSGWVGPHGSVSNRNPSDNSLAVGPDHVVQTVNSHFAIFTKTGVPVYGPVPTNTVFTEFGGPCETKNNGDAVVRYDQLAQRWLVVMPIFSRNPIRPDEPPAPTAGLVHRSVEGRAGQPGRPWRLPDSVPPIAAGRPPASRDSGSYSMCYAVSAGRDPRGPYYRYEFVRPLFPDYPRPAVWPDGYYVATSTGDEVIEKHACVVERARMLAGQPASEQCVVIADVNFLNPIDLDGTQLPPPGAPNLFLAAGGAQLRGEFADNGLYAWRFAVDWKDLSRTTMIGPERIAVAPYRYLCDGQLTKCVPQPGSDVRLDAQGDKLMARVVYRRIGPVQSIVAAPFGGDLGGRRRRSVVRAANRVDRRADSVSAGHLRAGRTVSVDGEPGHRPARQHRDWLFVRRPDGFRGPAVCRTAVRGSAREPTGPGVGVGHGPSRSNDDTAVGRLHPDRHRSGGRLHHLVRGRLPQGGSGQLFDSDRGLPPVGLPACVCSAAAQRGRANSRPTLT